MMRKTTICKQMHGKDTEKRKVKRRIDAPGRKLEIESGRQTEPQNRSELRRVQG